MPKIGKRILKSSLAVFLCFIIYLLRNEQGIVFYSCIAAVLCVQQTTTNTKKVARNRIEGTLIGGFMGMLVLVFEKNCIPHDLILIQYALISFMIIPIIYVTVVLKKTSASYISCVVFMSVTVSHAMDVNPFMFAIDRIMDTLIGIFVALFINGVRLPFYKHKKTLFIIDENDFAIHMYERIKLKQMMEQGAMISFITNKTPGLFLPKFHEFQMHYPILCYEGNAQYDIQTQHFHNVQTLPFTTYQDVLAYAQSITNNIFTHVIQYDMVHIYFHHHLDKFGIQYVQEHRKQPYDHYICATAPQNQNVIALMLYVTNKQAVLCQQHIQQYFPTCSCVCVEEQDAYVQCMITAQNDVATTIQNMAQTYHKENSCVFGHTRKLQSIYQHIQCYDGVDVIKKIRAIFYSFSKS